ncbi:MAG: hypothetical protein ACT4TC_12700 [Myxococcaceae bacterium]
MRWSLDSLEEHLPDVTFELAMTFALTNGTLPTEDLPVRSFLD